MKMHDIGKERMQIERSSVPGRTVERGKTYPTISLNENQCPFIKDWPTGEEYEMMIIVKKTGEHEPQEWDDQQNSMIHNFEIRKAGHHGEEKAKT